MALRAGIGAVHQTRAVALRAVNFSVEAAQVSDDRASAVAIVAVIHQSVRDGLSVSVPFQTSYY